MRRTPARAALALGIVLLVTLTLLSVMIVAWIGGIGSYDWTLVGNVGQSFGFAAAIFSALAFAALVWSVNLQVRESRAQRLEIHRQMHMQLISMALDDPNLQVAWPFHQDSLQAERRHYYLNLWFWWWRYNFQANIDSEEATKFNLRYALRSQAGRDYVERSRPNWGAAEDASTGKFFALVEEAYSQALTEPPEAVSTALATSLNARAGESSRANHAAWAASAMTSALVIGVLVRSRKFRR
jgi:hypothetical protein